MSDIRGKDAKAPALLPEPPRRAELPAPRPSDGSKALAVKLPSALARATRRGPGLGPFDKAFAVHVTGPQGVTNGVGRNISPDGMFVETREPYPIGTVLRITFSSAELQTELSAVAEVRFQCFLNFAGADGGQEGMRGMGVKFVKFEGDDGRDVPRAIAQ